MLLVGVVVCFRWRSHNDCSFRLRRALCPTDTPSRGVRQILRPGRYQCNCAGGGRVSGLEGGARQSGKCENPCPTTRVVGSSTRSRRRAGAVGPETLTFWAATRPPGFMHAPDVCQARHWHDDSSFVVGSDWPVPLISERARSKGKCLSSRRGYCSPLEADSVITLDDSPCGDLPRSDFGTRRVDGVNFAVWIRSRPVSSPATCTSSLAGTFGAPVGQIISGVEGDRYRTSIPRKSGDEGLPNWAGQPPSLPVEIRASNASRWAAARPSRRCRRQLHHGVGVTRPTCCR